MFQCSPEFPKCHVIWLFSHPWPSHQHGHYPTSRADLLNSSLKKNMFSSSPLTALHLSTSSVFFPFICSPFGAQYLSIIIFHPVVQISHAALINHLKDVMYHNFFSLQYISIYGNFVLVYPWGWMLKPRHNSIFKYIFSHCLFGFFGFVSGYIIINMLLSFCNNSLKLFSCTFLVVIIFLLA